MSANPFPVAMGYFETVRHKDTFLLVGGWDDQSGNFDTIWMYDVQNEDWVINEHGVSLPTPIRRHNAFMVDATLFTGGIHCIPPPN